MTGNSLREAVPARFTAEEWAKLDDFEKWFASQTKGWQHDHTPHSYSMRIAWNAAVDRAQQLVQLEIDRRIAAWRAFQTGNSPKEAVSK